MAADTYFGRVRQLFIARPENIATVGTVDMEYTVTAEGIPADVRILKNEIPATDGYSVAVRNEVGTAMWNAMRRSRYRPRILAGNPVATSGLTVSAEFCLDPSEIMPICRANANASVTRQ